MKTSPGTDQSPTSRRFAGTLPRVLRRGLLGLCGLCCGPLGCKDAGFTPSDLSVEAPDQADAGDLPPPADMATPLIREFPFAGQTLSSLMTNGWQFACDNGEAYFTVQEGALTHASFPMSGTIVGADCWATSPVIQPNPPSTCVQAEIRQTVSNVKPYNGSYVGVYREPAGLSPELLLQLNETPPGAVSFLVLPALSASSMTIKLRLHAGRMDVIPAAAWKITAIRLTAVPCPK